MESIHKDMTAAAKRQPDRLAVWSDRGELSCRELEERSDTLAAWLRTRGAGPGKRVAIMLPRIPDAVVSIFAVLKTGAAYVPLDPAWPAGRIARILENGRFHAWIATEPPDELCRGIPHVLRWNSPEWEEAIRPDANRAPHKSGLSAEDPAYILYTSGSTGIPKGVCISHRAARYFARWAAAEFGLHSEDRVAAVSPFTFDLSTFDLFSTLGAGAAVFLVSESTKMLPSQLSLFLEQHRITLLYAVPSTLTLLAARGRLTKRDLSALRCVLFAGEVFPPAALRKLMEQLPDSVDYANLYGPTETNVCAWHRVTRATLPDTAIPVGKPPPGTRIFLADGNTVLSGDAAEGELCVAGPGVMSGYWGMRPGEETCWIADPENAAVRAYRTGDLARKDAEGNWMYLGRKDGMVKIWGYRVELGEIEACLLACPGVEQAAAVKADTGEAGGELVAFIVPAGGAQEPPPGIEAVLAHCRKTLPRYMIPHRVCPIERMPLTDSGKINRRELTAQAERDAD